MKRWTSLAVVIPALLSGIASHSASAKDARFGCKVLLCPVATHPSWSGIPYCVPVMQQLRRREGWPSCPEAGSSEGGVGYEPYLTGLLGLTAMTSPSDERHALTPDPHGALCADLSKPRQSCDGGDRRGSKVDYPTMARALRDQPYQADISTAGRQQRIYFSLRSD